MEVQWRRKECNLQIKIIFDHANFSWRRTLLNSMLSFNFNPEIMETENKKHSLFSNIKNKYKVFSMRNTKSKCRFLGFRKKFSKSNFTNENIKGVNISFKDNYSSDTVVNSSGEQTSSTSVSVLSESFVVCPSENTNKGQDSVGGESKSSIEYTGEFRDATIACDRSASKSNSYSNSRSSLSQSLQDSSLTSLLSESSSSYKYDKKPRKYSSSIISTHEHQNSTDNIDHTNYEYIRTPNEENRLDEEIFIKKNKYIPAMKPKNRSESCTRTDGVNNSRGGTFCLNKSMLDILNSRDQIKEEKRTTQQVVAIENIDTHGKDAPRSFAPNDTDHLRHKQDIQDAFKESCIEFNDKELLTLVPIIIEPICCHIKNYSDYNILIDCVCINDDQYDLCSFTDILY